MNLELLRQKIRAIEWHEHESSKTLSFGAQSIDEALPYGGLKSGCVHEWTGPYRGPLTGVCASILGRMSHQTGPILWCASQIDVFPSGLLSYGLRAENIIFAKLESQKELLWAVEEGLQTPQLCAVIAEVGSISLTAYRRLQLAAQKSGVTLFLLIDFKNAQQVHSNCVSRWLVEPLPSNNAPGLFRDNGVGAPRFAVTLSRCRGAVTPQKWNLEWNVATLSFNLLPEQFIARERRHAVAV
jgi:protein ImuA